MKPIIYQLLPRLWGNSGTNNIKGGCLESNGTGKFSGIDSPTLEYIKWMGCTHVWLTGILRHATKECSAGCMPSHPQFVKGEAGSPYAITDYYDVNPYLADNPEMRMKEFDELVERIHAAGLKVIMDFVPNHVARDYGKTSIDGDIPDEQKANLLGAGDDTSVHWSPENDFIYYPGSELVLPNEHEFVSECNSLINNDFQKEYKIVPAWLVKMRKERPEDFEKYRNFLAPYKENPPKATGNAYTPTPRQNDWYETIKINYCDGHGKTWDKMLSVLEFWAGRGVDGFRCDMVELVPQQFFKWAIREIKTKHPEIIFIAEVYKRELYKTYIRDIGFDYLYDKSGLYDTLRNVVSANVKPDGMPLELWQSARGITRNWQYLGDIQPYMLNFIENHDEQRFASDYFGLEAGNTFAPMYVSLCLNKAAFMIYAGEEVGERGMDEEGFSGRDGKTSIFDWWNPWSMKALGQIVHGRLYLDEKSDWPDGISRSKAFFFRFTKLIKFASQDPAVSCGTTYDLCYCNTASEGFNPDRHFAFLRDSNNETLLFAVNFSQTEAVMELYIPEHAFEWLEIQRTDKLNPSVPVEVKVPPMDGVVVELCQ